VKIVADGGSSYTFGVEAGDGGRVTLSSTDPEAGIVVNGAGAAGARAYKGKDKTRAGVIDLTGVNVSVTGTNSVGLMAGDKDGEAVDAPTSGGIISYKKGTVIAEGTAARVWHGSSLTLEDAHLVATEAGS